MMRRPGERMIEMAAAWAARLEVVAESTKLYRHANRLVGRVSKGVGRTGGSVQLEGISE